MKQLLDRDAFVYVAAAGAGAGVQKTLWDTPGASSYLAGAEFPYSPAAMETFIGYRPEKFVSMTTAVDMAIASYLKAANGCPEGKSPVGIGATASVATIKQHRGAHRVCVAAISRLGVYGEEIKLEKRDSSARDDDGAAVDAIITHAILTVTNHTTMAWVIGENLGNISEGDFRQSIASRPLFTRTGRRLPVPMTQISLFPGAFNPVHAGHLANTTESTIFQITTRPPHKDPLTIHEQLNRVAQIRKDRDVLLLEGAGPYLEKARLFPGSTIILGPDALQRMLDPKWGYETLPLLRELQTLKVNFKVSHRDETLDPLASIPVEFVHMFSRLPKTEFSGLSSTQIREAAAKKASAESSP